MENQSSNTVGNTVGVQYLQKAVAELLENPKNARTHSKAQIDKIAKSIERFKFLNPILIDEAGVVIAGHGRLAAARKIGLERVPCVLASHLTETEKRAYMLADNRLALDAGWDKDMLKVELKELQAGGFDLGFTGFEVGEIAGLTGASRGSAEDDNIPDAPVVPVSRLGDTWLLDKHRVRCGSSTDPADVAALLNGAKPHLMVTDPPYGVEYDADWRNRVQRSDGSVVGGLAVGKVLNDDRADWLEAWNLFPGSVAYIWHASLHGHTVQSSIERAGYHIRSVIIWAKNVFAIGRGDYHWQHEPCLYAVRKGGKSHWNGSRKETTLWNIDKPQKSDSGHSTQKPVECMRRPILNNSKGGDIVYDPFLGSGTTVIAAETEGRICYGMELNPAYVDVIVRRWCELTGKSAVLESSGETFEALSSARMKDAA